MADQLLAFCTCLSSLWLGQACAHLPCDVAAAGTLNTILSIVMPNLCTEFDTQCNQETLSKMVTEICLLADARSWSSIVSGGKKSTRQQLSPPVLAAAFQVCPSLSLSMRFSSLPSNYSLPRNSFLACCMLWPSCILLHKLLLTL